MVDTQWMTRRRRRTVPVVLVLILVIVGCAVGGALYIALGSNGKPPAFPATPPHAHQIGASQVTQMLGSNQIISIALYRVPAPPAAVIAFYRRTLPGHGGSFGRFNVVIRSRSLDALPTTLQQMPRAFIDGTGVTPTTPPAKDTTPVRYTFTQYNTAGNDVGVAVDLHHPRGPTLVFVEMLSE